MKIKHFNLQVGCQIFKAFSDDNRVRILYLLNKTGEMCISDLEQVLDFTQTKTSRHLGYLKNSGLVSYRKVDQWVYYYIKEEVKGIVEQVFSFLERDTVLENDIKSYQTLYANNYLAVRKLHARQNTYELPEL